MVSLSTDSTLMVLFGVVLSQLTYIDCDQSFTYNGQNFVVADHHATWNEARWYCNGLSRGGDLAQPTDANALATYLANNGYSKVWHWVGAEKINGVYQWINGKPIAGGEWHNVHAGKPFMKGDCVSMKPDQGYGLYRRECAYETNFICQTPTH